MEKALGGLLDETGGCFKDITGKGFLFSIITNVNDDQTYFMSMILSYFILEVANRKTRNGSVEVYNVFDFEFGCFCTSDYCNSSGILKITTLFLGISAILCIFK